MKFIALSFLVTACASLAQAELKYITYDITSGEATKLASAPTDIATNETYRNGSTILFVQDPSVSEEYYIGVFEVTNAQAKALGWTNSKTEGDAIAYAANYTVTSSSPTFSLDNEKHPLLSLPTQAQWKKDYAGDIQPRSESKDDLQGATPIGYNFRNGFYYEPFDGWVELYSSGVNPEDWPGFLVLPELSAWPWLGTASSKHGAYDMYGNVAEITQEGVYMGGCASQTYSTDGESLAFALSNENKNIAANGYLGARLIYTPEESATFTVTVQLNGETQEGLTQTGKVGDTITFTLPTPTDGTELYAVEVSPEVTLASEGTTVSFTMPVGNVTINYIYKKFVTITVEGGTSSKPKCAIDETVEITPTLPTKYSAFNAWAYPSSLESMVTENSVTHALTFTPTDELTLGSVVTFTASYDTYPRVLVYGGTVEVKSGTHLGDGYYTAGATLKLTAPEINGYTVKWWRDNLATNGSTEITVGEMNAGTVIYTAIYEAESGSGITQTLPTFGETLPFGYTTADASVILAGNKYTFDALTVAEQVVLDLEEKTIDFEAEDSSTLLTDGKHLALLRVDPKKISETLNGDETIFYTNHRVLSTYREQAPYYLAVTELTESQREKIDGTEGITKKPEAAPAAVATKDAANTIMEKLNEIFKDKKVFSELPSQMQCEIAALVGYTTEMTFVQTGAYYTADGQVNTVNVLCNKTDTDTTVPGVVTAAGKTSLGFYGLLGNYGEWIEESETEAPAGILVYSDGSYPHANYSDERMLTLFASVPYSDGVHNARVTCRPLIPSERTGVTVTLKIGADEKTVTVPKGEINLGSPVVAGKAFKGWRVNDATTIAEGNVFTVEADTTFTAVFDDVALIAITYEGCTGATSLPAGGQTLLYPTGTTEVVAWKVLINGEERTDCVADILLTIPTDAKSVSVTAIYKTSGYLLRLK
ncbi:MAG: hypothetical protein Q4F99_02525 [bacterium]|nr:hypothetical protein [bacterium]